jgi:hypothetical protein
MRSLAETKQSKSVKFRPGGLRRGARAPNASSVTLWLGKARWRRKGFVIGVRLLCRFHSWKPTSIKFAGGFNDDTESPLLIYFSLAIVLVQP